VASIPGARSAIKVEPDEIDGGFVAECLDVPGAMAQGETEEEALEALSEALQDIVEAGAGAVGYISLKRPPERAFERGREIAAGLGR
jgi:predicted RNase H-like HicB family nuclease